MVDQPLHPALEAIVQALEDSVDFGEQVPASTRDQFIWSLPNLLEALEKAGWAIVPHIPTIVQSKLGADEIDGWNSYKYANAKAAYKAMIQAGKVRL